MSETDVAPVVESPPRVPEPPYAIELREADAVRRWWQRLTLSAEALKAHTDAPAWPKGLRATLRRCDTIEAAMITEAFRHLWRQLPEGGEKNQWQRDQILQIWACTALVAAPFLRLSETIHIFSVLRWVSSRRIRPTNTSSLSWA
jgi:CRISPR system Cascade subunit CasB